LVLLKPAPKTFATQFNKKNSEQLGLGNNGKIFLCPLDGIETLNYLNNTKENKVTSSKKIDIYMGENIEKARNWGAKKITLQYASRPERPIGSLQK